MNLFDPFTITLNNAEVYLGHIIVIKYDHIILHLADTNIHQFILLADIFSMIPAIPYWM